jgi:hypothetical protein
MKALMVFELAYAAIKIAFHRPVELTVLMTLHIKAF